MDYIIGSINLPNLFQPLVFMGAILLCRKFMSNYTIFTSNAKTCNFGRKSKFRKNWEGGINLFIINKSYVSYKNVTVLMEFIIC